MTAGPTRTAPPPAPSEVTVEARLNNLPPLNLFNPLKVLGAQLPAGPPAIVRERSTPDDPLPERDRRMWAAVTDLNLQRLVDALADGARPDRPDPGSSQGNGVLHRLADAPPVPAHESARATMVEHLVRAGAPVDLRNTQGLTPLLLAARHERWALVGALLDLGADPNVESHRDETLVGHALGALRLDLMDRLLDQGLDVAHRVNGQPLLMALLTNPSVARDAPLEQRRAMLHRLLAYGASVNAAVPEREGFTPLHAAVMHQPDLIPDLLAAGAWPNAPRQVSVSHHPADALSDTPSGTGLLRWTSQGWTALHLAALQDLPVACEQLLAAGADPHARTSTGGCPMLVKQHLMAHQALPEPSPGLTPIEVAQRSGRKRSLAVLERSALHALLHDGMLPPALQDDQDDPPERRPRL